MQNKYFGDILDFYKYYFLRQISIDNSLGIHWCLVPDENMKSDGEKPLTNKEKLIDPDLYQILSDSRINNNRNINNIKPYFDRHMNNDIKYFTDLHVDFYRNYNYEESAIKHLKNQDIIFFDPDNGIEVSSMTNMKRYKYVSFRLLQRFWEMGKSLIIFQYERDPKHTDKMIEILYDLLLKKPNIVTVKKGFVKYICVINAEAGH